MRALTLAAAVLADATVTGRAVSLGASARGVTVTVDADAGLAALAWARPLPTSGILANTVWRNGHTRAK